MFINLTIVRIMQIKVKQLFIMMLQFCVYLLCIIYLISMVMTVLEVLFSWLIVTNFNKRVF
jgi:hypothetical protein